MQRFAYEWPIKHFVGRPYIMARKCQLFFVINHTPRELYYFFYKVLWIGCIAQTMTGLLNYLALVLRIWPYLEPHQSTLWIIWPLIVSQIVVRHSKYNTTMPVRLEICHYKVSRRCLTRRKTKERPLHH